jgi:hypothetical protein
LADCAVARSATKFFTSFLRAFHSVIHNEIPATAALLCSLVLVNESRVGSKAAPAGQDLRTVGWDRRDSG